MAESPRPLTPHTLSVRAARTLSHATLTVPQMLAESPRWLLHLLPWVNIYGGVTIHFKTDYQPLSQA